MRISDDGLNIIKHYEGLFLDSYLCPANVWTIGWGHTRTTKKGQRITKEKAERLLQDDLSSFESGVLSRVSVALNQKQFDSLVSFAFNVGLGSFGSSTLLKKLNAGDYKGAADQLLVWNKAGGKVLKGLSRRRYAERAVFLGADSSVALKEAERNV